MAYLPMPRLCDKENQEKLRRPWASVAGGAEGEMFSLFLQTKES